MENGISFGISRSKNPSPPDTQNVIVTAVLCIDAKMFTWLCFDSGDREENPNSATKDIPADETDTLDDRFGDLVESSDDFVGEHDIQIVQVRGAPLEGFTEGFDWRSRRKAPPGSRSESSIGRARFGFQTRLVDQGV